MVSRKKLDSLYNKYGFDLTDTYPDIGIYQYKKSRYFGVDIVPFSEKDETNKKVKKIKSDYSTLGFATEIKRYKSIKDVEEELYKSFFSFESTTERLKTKYKRFVKNQSSKLPGNTQYEYIDSPFDIINKDKEKINIIREIEHILNLDQPQLIIIEAAAGYGKTCTAFELLNFLTDCDNCKNPIFTELSRNRGAKIFRYVLLDEIDLEYPTLNSELVKYEISTGRIPLVIDGFDELLDKSPMELYDDFDAFEEVESMLDTIGNLLVGNAKIILTSRRTAIFTGNGFNQWLSKWDDKFKSTIFSIKEPRISDWIGLERYKKVKEQNLPIQYISNPVLLSFIKNIDNKAFEGLILEPKKLVWKYFNSILERETERQNLLIRPEDQYRIFRNVTQILIEFDDSAEEKNFFRQIILDQNTKLIENARILYPASSRPTMDELADTLATHALLDRKGRNNDLIGFINDFVFGTFIGEIIIDTPIEKINKDFSSYMIELGATAYKVQNIEAKIKLWEKINQTDINFEISSLFNFDITLQEKLMRDYTEGVFENFAIYNIRFTNSYRIESSVFINCKFKNSELDVTKFINTSFVKCSFDNCCLSEQGYLDDSDRINVIQCKQTDCNILVYSITQLEKKEEFDDFEKDIFQRIFKIAGEKTTQSLLNLLHGYEEHERRKVIKKLEEFENQKFIKINGSNLLVEINKISWIRNKLD